MRLVHTHRLNWHFVRTSVVSHSDGNLFFRVLCDARFTTWCVTEIKLNADRALDRLEQLSPNVDGNVATTLCVVAALSRDDIRSRSRRFRHAGPWSPQQMKRLLLLCRRFIRTADDLERQGAYSPTDRDYAERFRNGLLEMLANNASSETPMVLRSLFKEPALSVDGDYVLELIARRRCTDAAGAPWKEEDIAGFKVEFESEPKLGEELYLITRRRLTQLRYDVEESDNSVRDEVRSDQDEKTLCRWIARKLSVRSRRRYVVPIETEIDQDQHPDLRIERSGLPPVPIEVKWAEKWSYNELVERLENHSLGSTSEPTTIGMVSSSSATPMRKQRRSGRKAASCCRSISWSLT